MLLSNRAYGDYDKETKVLVTPAQVANYEGPIESEFYPGYFVTWGTTGLIPHDGTSHLTYLADISGQPLYQYRSTKPCLIPYAPGNVARYMAKPIGCRAVCVLGESQNAIVGSPLGIAAGGHLVVLTSPEAQDVVAVACEAINTLAGETKRIIVEVI